MTSDCICPAVQPHGSNPVPPTTDPDCPRHDPASHAFGFGFLSRSVVEFHEGRITGEQLWSEFEEIRARVDAYEKNGER